MCHFYLRVQRNDATLGTSAHHDVAARLADIFESETLKSLEGFSAGNSRQFRHGPERRRT